MIEGWKKWGENVGLEVKGIREVDVFHLIRYDVVALVISGLDQNEYQVAIDLAHNWPYWFKGSVNILFKRRLADFVRGYYLKKIFKRKKCRSVGMYGFGNLEKENELENYLGGKSEKF